MQLSAAGLELVEISEGFRSKTYFDMAGFPTIGYGHRLEPHESFPDGVTETEAEVILRWDVRQAELEVARLVKVSLTQGQFDALVDFVFNLGSSRLASSTLLLDLNAGRYDAAAAELLRWDHTGYHEVAALKARRQAEYKLWQSDSVTRSGAQSGARSSTRSGAQSGADSENAAA
jgi:lysozyme